MPCNPMGDPTLEKVYPEGLQPMGRTHAGEGEKHEKERNSSGLLQPHPFPISFVLHGVQGSWELEELGVKE